MKSEKFKYEMNEIHADEELINKTIKSIKASQELSKKQNHLNLKKIIAGTVAALTLSVGSVGAYVAVTGNTQILERLGINISKNYDKHRQDISVENGALNKVIADNVELELKSASFDSASIVMEFDMKLYEEYDAADLNLKVGKCGINMPSRDLNVGDRLVVEQKQSIQKMDDGTYKVFIYLALNDPATDGSVFWEDIFCDDDRVDCSVNLLGIYDKDNQLILLDEGADFEFTLEKPQDNNELDYVRYDDNQIVYNNVTASIMTVQSSDFGNIISLVAYQDNIDLNKVNEIQKIDFVIRDENGNKLNVISKTYNITWDNYKNGKYSKVGIEYQITLDDTLSNLNYDIELEETDTVQISTEKLVEVHTDTVNSLRDMEVIVPVAGGYVPLYDYLIEGKDYYKDDYGIYVSDRTSAELSALSGMYVVTSDDIAVPIEDIKDENDYYMSDDGFLRSNKTCEELVD